MYLILDGGATKTHLLLLDNNLQILKEDKTGPFNFSVISPQKAITNLKACLNKHSLSQIDKAIFGLAGIDTIEEKLKTEQIFANSFDFPISIINDAQLALAAGTQNENAVVIIAGTGSNCFGHNAKGQIAHTSGLDWLLSDEGSGFSIGLAILRSSIRSFDGRGQKTCLQDLVTDHFNIDHLYDLKHIVYSPDFAKDDIADLSKLLDIGLKNNDPVSQLILENNIGELLIALRPVVNRLALASLEFDLVLAGSLFTKKIIPYQDFSSKVIREFPQANIILLEKPPVYGGLNLLKNSSS